MENDVIIIGFSNPTSEGVILHLNKKASLKTENITNNEFWVSWDKIGAELFNGYTEKQEKFAEVQRAIEVARLQIERDKEVEPYLEFIPCNLNLGVMSVADYSKILVEYKVRFMMDETYEVVELSNENEQKVHQGSLADCEAYIRLRNQNQF